MDDNTTPLASARRRRNRWSAPAEWRAATDIPPLQPPVLVDAEGVFLDPANVDLYITAWLPPWPGMAAGDVCTLCWLGRDARGGITRFSSSRQATTRALVDGMVFAVPVAQLRMLVGGHVSVHYIVHAFALDEPSASYPRPAVARLASQSSMFAVRPRARGGVAHALGRELPPPRDGLDAPLDHGADLTLDCDGYVVAEGQPPAQPPEMATYCRLPRGGVPPFRFASSNPVVAQVDNDGRVRVGANGTTEMSVTDRNGQHASHWLQVRGAKVWRARAGWRELTFAELMPVLARESDLLRPPANRAEIEALRRTYASDLATLDGLEGVYWTAETSNANGFRWAVALNDGAAERVHVGQRRCLMALVR